MSSTNKKGAGLILSLLTAVAGAVGLAFCIVNAGTDSFRKIGTKEASMVQSVTYQSETKTVHFQGKSIVLESLTPVLSPKEKEKRKKEIERCLYEVFSKYRRASDTPA